MQPNFQVAPDGTRMWLLHIGNLVADEGVFLPFGNVSTASHPVPETKRRKLVMISVLIEHPEDGIFLFETGAGKDYPDVWGPQLADIFAREDHSEDLELDTAIRKTGHDIKDVKGVIIGHLHLDHAGGLEYFRGTDVPIYVHELELKHSFYSVATKTDIGVYLPTYLQFDLNWKPLHGDSILLARGITVHLCPGHTPGLCILQVNLKSSGTWIFTSDQYVVQENYDNLSTQGWLTRDHAAWSMSNQLVHMLQKATRAKVIFGHDRDVLLRHNLAPLYYE
ncbi:metallo-hydrolase oxidoreductase [Fusarium sporotrichioides]|uniref:Metallo-hydrolase oxidoreductase n=1 Tax=Fusarium sporotrichioides TaxID=5514 RepID=A0A395SFT2_FUSSP|nr:metallo-hydrolase oxidoreductase [Fusarium sporotrichioides]